MSKIPFQRIALAGFLISSVFPVMSQTTETWETDEYYRSGGLDVINAAEAYAAGYTGKGIRIGIIDTGAEFDNSELSGKVDIFPAIKIEDDFVSDKDAIHGAHVSGIAGAKRDGLGMHGVAFDSPMSFIRWKYAPGDLNRENIEDITRRVSKTISSDPTVRVINNSWGSWGSIRNLKPENFYEFWKESGTLASSFLLEQVKWARYDDKVIVFAAGNDAGQPSLECFVPYFDPSVKSWLSVTSVDPKGVRRNHRGDVKLVSRGLPWYTNRAGLETALYSLAAPGSNILAPDFTENGLISETGTSMAAPHVSGAVAVTAQAFPWMTGKQLADTILTTTDRIILPKFAIQYCGGWDPFVFIVDKDQEVDLSELATKDNLRRLIRVQWPGEQNKRSRKSILAQLDAFFEEHGENPQNWEKFIIRTSSEEVFGQGLLNVGNAVKGIGKLDVNRMSVSNIRELHGLDGKIKRGAVESFDTKGFSAVFSNDIDERRWDDKYHHADFQTSSSSGKNGDALALKDLGAGLEKTGEGLLILSGKNTYTGPTIVSGGRLSISKREDGTGGVLVKSKVFVNEGGILQGNGTIRRSVHNNGIVAPGNSIGTLTVGDYRAGENGILSMEFNPEGDHDRLTVTGTAYLGGELQLIPQKGFYQVGNGFTFQLIEGKTEGDFENLTVNPQSPVLSFDVTQTEAGLNLNPERHADAYSRYATNAGAARLGDALLRLSEKAEGKTADLMASIDFSDPSGREIAKALRTMHPEVYDVGTMAEWDTLAGFNRGTLKRALSKEPTAEGFRVTMIGDVRRRHGHNGFTGWRSEEKGIELAWTSAVAEGLTMTGDASVLQRDAELSRGLSGKVESTAAYVGLSVQYDPLPLQGATVFGAMRLGLSDNDLTRTVLLPGHVEKIESDWTGVSGSLMAGADWHWENDSWRIGPVVWSEVVAAHREHVSEKTTSAAGLRLDGQTFTRTTVNAGLHMGGRALKGKSIFTTDLYLTRRENLSENSVESRAAFTGTQAGFKSSTDHAARDAWVIDAGCSLITSAVFVDLKAGAEIAETGGADSSVHIKLGRYF